MHTQDNLLADIHPINSKSTYTEVVNELNTCTLPKALKILKFIRTFSHGDKLGAALMELVG